MHKGTDCCHCNLATCSSGEEAIDLTLTNHSRHDTSYFLCQLEEVGYSRRIKQLVLYRHKK
jgi:hypothetical protein